MFIYIYIYICIYTYVHIYIYIYKYIKLSYHTYHDKVVHGKLSGKKSRHVARDHNIENKRIVKQVIKKLFENHPSIKQIQKNFQYKHIPLTP